MSGNHLKINTASKIRQKRQNAFIVLPVKYIIKFQLTTYGVPSSIFLSEDKCVIHLSDIFEKHRTSLKNTEQDIGQEVHEDMTSDHFVGCYSLFQIEGYMWQLEKNQTTINHFCLLGHYSHLFTEETEMSLVFGETESLVAVRIYTWKLLCSTKLYIIQTLLLISQLCSLLEAPVQVAVKLLEELHILLQVLPAEVCIFRLQQFISSLQKDLYVYSLVTPKVQVQECRSYTPTPYFLIAASF